MESIQGHAVYRIRRTNRTGKLPKNYQHTLQVLDEASQQVMASGDLAKNPIFSPLNIEDAEGGIWEMRPNRKIMPSRWTLKQPDQQVHAIFDQKILGKLLNPLYKVVMTIEDDQGTVTHRVVDMRSNIVDRVINLSIGDYAVMQDEEPVAKFIHLPSEQETERPRGLLGKLRRLLTSSDEGVLSVGGAHVLSAPATLCMLVLRDAFTDVSRG